MLDRADAESPGRLRAALRGPGAQGRSVELAERILAWHDDAGVSTESQLPTERKLAEQLGVTRTAVRNALAVLEAEGLVSREIGRGTFLLAEATSRHAPGTHHRAVAELHVGPGDVMHARRVIEPQVVPLVVAWATESDFDEMRRCVEGGGHADSYAEFEAWDFALHHAIVAASRNRLLQAMYAVVEEARRGRLWGNLKRRNDSLERRTHYQADHAAMVGALAARELDLAREFTERHLDRVEANLLHREDDRRGET